ncbi:hypothetical protein V5799_026635 [Amblyomma americanum]|uniref:PKS/mFAS DH domain-containing protein n=1 Tax=Amblyomma americanum TaxID=6943 RepID=A0AAQ4DI09_AMBAM
MPASRWHEPAAKLCSAEYEVNNLLSPVLFREALQRVPADAIVVEIAPHCLLQGWSYDTNLHIPVEKNAQSAEDVVEVDLEASNVDAYMTGHELDGRIIFPAAGYFVLAWKYLAKRSGKPYKEVPVIFEDMIFHRAIILSKSGPIRFLVSIMRTSGEFEISEAGKVAASGRIRMAEEREVVLEKEPPGPPAQVVGFELDANDIYKELRLRGYEYSGKFQSILKADLQGGDPKKKTEYAFLNVQTRGDLSTLQWFASPLSCTIPVSSTLCSVYYAPLNFHDVMLATGKIAPEALSGTKEKREFLQRRFPQLDDRQIASSRDLSFEEHVLRETKGRGVDLVLNSLSEEKLQASLRCLASHGRFLEIGKFDLAKDSMLGMSVFLKRATFSGVHLETARGKCPSALEDQRRLKKLIQEGIVSGVVRPLDTIRFSREEAEEAFRFMASGKHIGKVVLEVRPEERARETALASPLEVEAVARTWFYEHKAYIVVGGLGGFGLELAEWMVSRGCRKLLLSSRSGVRTGYQKRCLQRWQQSGAEVISSRADASTEEGARQLIEEASAIGPIGGIFNLALASTKTRLSL